MLARDAWGAIPEAPVRFRRYNFHMPGLGEFIVLIAIPFGIWVAYRLLTRTTWIERLVVRAAQRRFSIGRLPPRVVRTPEGPIVPFPVTFAALLTAAAAIVIMASSGKLFVHVSYSGSVEIVWLHMTLSFLLQLLLIIALILHWSGSQNRWRRSKYELMFAYFALIVFGGLVDGLAEWQMSGSVISVSPFEDALVRIEWQSMCWLFAIPIFLLILGIFGHRIARNVSVVDDGIYRRAVHLHRRIAPIGNLAVVVFVVASQSGIGTVIARVFPALGILFVLLFISLFLYLQIRFQLKQLLVAHPIIYLRSFHSDAAALAFARIVAPVASRYGILAGLVHSVQPAHMLQQNVSTLARGGFVEVSDDRWREWVRQALASCHLVIIDVSNSTESVKWELETATNIVGPQRILCIEHREDLAESHVWQVDRVYYALDKQRTELARRVLARWFAKAVDAPLNANATSATASSIRIATSIAR